MLGVDLVCLELRVDQGGGQAELVHMAFADPLLLEVLQAVVAADRDHLVVAAQLHYVVLFTLRKRTFDHLCNLAITPLFQERLYYESYI